MRTSPGGRTLDLEGLLGNFANVRAGMSAARNRRGTVLTIPGAGGKQLAGLCGTPEP